MNLQQINRKLDEIMDEEREYFSFIINRIRSEKYRGLHCAQHNRLNFDQIDFMLKLLKNKVNRGLMAIRHTDISKDEFQTSRGGSANPLYTYHQYSNEVSKWFQQTYPNDIKRESEDSIRKIIFPDLNRMLLIDRYDFNKNLVEPYNKFPLGPKGGCRYVKLSEFGEQFITNYNHRNRNQALNNLFDMNIPHDIVRIADENNFDYITDYEYMFFITFINHEIGNVQYTRSKISKFIRSWREKRSKLPNHALIKLVKEYADPNNWPKGKYDKTDKRDFGNLKNQQQTAFHLLGQHKFFKLAPASVNSKYDYSYEKLYIRKNGSIEEGSEYIKYVKRLKPTIEMYKKKHHKNYIWRDNFEHHHIVHLNVGKNQHWAELDVWDNLLYINASPHKSIHHKYPKDFYKIEFQKNYDVHFISIQCPEKRITCKYEKEVIYDPMHIETLLNKNKELLSKF